MSGSVESLLRNYTQSLQLYLKIRYFQEASMQQAINQNHKRRGEVARGLQLPELDKIPLHSSNFP